MSSPSEVEEVSDWILLLKTNHASGYMFGHEITAFAMGLNHWVYKFSNMYLISSLH